jgi:hypothetical protein
MKDDDDVVKFVKGLFEKDSCGSAAGSSVRCALLSAMLIPPLVDWPQEYSGAIQPSSVF